MGCHIISGSNHNVGNQLPREESVGRDRWQFIELFVIQNVAFTMDHVDKEHSQEFGLEDFVMGKNLKEFVEFIGQITWETVPWHIIILKILPLNFYKWDEGFIWLWVIEYSCYFCKVVCLIGFNIDIIANKIFASKKIEWIVGGTLLDDELQLGDILLFVFSLRWKTSFIDVKVTLHW